MPIYEDENRTREDLFELRKKNRCQVCGGKLNVFLDHETHKAYLACWDWLRTHHEGIVKEASRYQKEGLASLNIKTRRETMEQQFGEEKTKALDKARLPMTGALTQPQAMHILKLVYPNVPEDQIIRTAILCRDFGLHPLMKEVYILGFKNKSGGIDFATVIGISASRKMAADRKGAYSFLDDTPRAATPEEIIKQYGKNSEEERDNLISICHLKGERGNEATGFGLWPKNKEPYGTDKGNTKRNMANIRSERPAYNRLPGEALPQIEVIDEAYAQVPDVGKVNVGTGQIIEGEFKEVNPESLAPEPKSKEHWCEEHNCPYEKKTRGSSTWYAHKLPDGSWCNEAKKKEQAPKAVSHIPESIGELPSDEPGAEVEHNKPERDPDTIKTINELQKALFEDFQLQPKQQLAELNLDSWTELAISPADAYKQVAATR